MKLNTLPSLKNRKNKRLGRGYGSGKGGHTSSRGQKGQKSRGSVPAHFVGTSWVWFKRLPFLRGKSRFVSLNHSFTLTLSDLDRFPEGTTVDVAKLVEVGLIGKTDANRAKVKVVNSGKLSKNLQVNLPVTPAAKTSIEKAKGIVGGQDR